MNNLLIEIGTEDLPSNTLTVLINKLTNNISCELKKFNIKYIKIIKFFSSRRLAIIVLINIFSLKNIISSKYFLLIYKLAKNKQNINNNISNYVSCILSNKYKLHSKYFITNILFAIVHTAISNIKVPNMMRWGDNNMYFVRPVNNIIVLLDNYLIHGTIFGVNSNNIIHGHRFMGLYNINIKFANQYPKILMNNKVIVDFNKRKYIILNQIKNITDKLNGYVNINYKLLEEITSIIEWPKLLVGSFESKFLFLPSEILIHIIQDIQKCFPIYDNNGALSKYYILATNIISNNNHIIIKDNNTVINNRLKDAELFFIQDRKKKLADYLINLKNISFHTKLGSMFDKSYRLQQISSYIAYLVGANISWAARAAIISKCDLATSMVKEFNNTKGIIGMYYASLDNEILDVINAQKEQYTYHINNNLVINKISCILIIANSIDNIVGFFGINKLPTGSKDPFALRRAAISIIKIIIKNKLYIDIKKLIEYSIITYNNDYFNQKKEFLVINITKFIFNRLCFWYKKNGINENIVSTLLTRKNTNLVNLNKIIVDVSKFIKLDKLKTLISTYKRLVNFLNKYPFKINTNFKYSSLKDSVEINLFYYLEDTKQIIKKFIIEKKYYQILIKLTKLCNVINKFIDTVQIIVSDNLITSNRLLLINNCYDLLLKVVNLSLLTNFFNKKL
ncbi:MAG: glycine--tRNA ligase subunit beta [Candidatus Lightella neohaematopini]|nr:glycine--tRNA ligase subunit beta [Candidatus Lightella neohaematopini]